MCLYILNLPHNLALSIICERGKLCLKKEERCQLRPNPNGKEITTWRLRSPDAEMEGSGQDAQNKERRSHDLVIFGVTGFTGYFVVRELVQTIQAFPDEYGHLRWAVAGRNPAKLAETLRKVGEEVKINLDCVPKLVADVADTSSLVAMASSCSVLLNCVGPFRKYGEIVIMACLKAGTHHLDITAELDWINEMTLRYHRQAIEQNVLILFACGFGCIPFDNGLEYLKKNFGGRLHSADCLMEPHFGAKGYQIHSGTLISVMYNFTLSNMRKINRLERKLAKEVLVTKVPKSETKHPMRLLRYRRSAPKGWTALYWVVEAPIANRSQHYNYQEFNEHPASLRTYYKARSTLEMLGIGLGGGAFGLFNFFPPFRWFVEKFPLVATFGWFSHAGPSRKQIDGASFTATFIGRGWSQADADEVSDPTAEPKGKPNKKVVLKVEGPDPGYITTAICLVQAGLTLLTQRHLMPRFVDGDVDVDIDYNHLFVCLVAAHSPRALLIATPNW